MRHHLARVTSAADWQATHRIRRAVLWDARGRRGYDDHHPDDRSPDHHPFVLKLDGKAIGTVRLDDLGEGTGAVRLVAVTTAHQGRGHGRELMVLVETVARRLGLRRLVVNAAVDAVGFYAELGWSSEPWADPDTGSSDVTSTPMIKDLVQPR